MNHTDYTVDQLAVDLARKVTELVERNRRLERLHTAITAAHAKPGSAAADYELAHALADLEPKR